MYERMLDKNFQPTFDEMLEYCGESGSLWGEIDDFLRDHYDLERDIRFPYGKDYGWGVNYKHRNKHICDIHAKRNAFTVFFQIRFEAIEMVKSHLSDYAIKVWENRYPCGNGGWIRYRVTKKENLPDIFYLLTAKVKPNR